MKTNLQKYAEYKDSRIAWLGTVPAEWAIVRNKEIFKERSSLSTTGKETLLTVSHITGVTPRSEKNVNMFMAKTMVGYKICREGDLVINTMWAWMGALGTSNELGICSPSYNVYMPRKGVPYNHRYFDYLFRIPNSIMEMTRNSKGIVSSRLRLYAKDFFQIETVLPSLEEQEAIATYLNTKTAQIDRKIDLLAQKAQRYEELKRSLINETVTRGLDESVPMKDSGMDEIGKVPEHWVIRRVKDEFINLDYKRVPISGEIRGNMKNPVYDYYGASGVIDKVEQYIFDEPLILIGEDGANLLMRGSPLAFIARGKYWVNNHAHILKPKKGNLEFLCHLLESLDYTKFVSGAAQPKLTSSALNDVFLVIPPIPEQNSIADYLNQKTNQINTIIQSINTQVEKLKELRKTLINDVVTGKIKVA